MNENRSRTSKHSGPRTRKNNSKGKPFTSKASGKPQRKLFSSHQNAYNSETSQESKFSKRKNDSRKSYAFKSNSSSDSKYTDTQNTSRSRTPFKHKDKSSESHFESKFKRGYSKPKHKRFDSSRDDSSVKSQSRESTHESGPYNRTAFQKDKRPFRNTKSDFKKPYKPKFNTDTDLHQDEAGTPRKRFSERPSKTFNTHTKGAFHKSKREFDTSKKENAKTDGPMRLNKYLSNAGIASRREADQLIQSGAVKVNGQVVDQLGYKINPGDQVVFNNQNIMHERKVYLLLNKPKDCITTSDDPRGRKTVMDYIQGACKERVYPVGRLDRNTTGVLLFTNDGELTTRLTHPKHGIRKIYHVTLNRNLKPEDFKQLVDGIELEDGPMKADDISFDGTSRREVGIELHSGRNRIVRRMFEHLGYEVVKLDRVMFAGLTKKDMSRGHYRLLNPKEVAFLKMLS